MKPRRRTSATPGARRPAPAGAPSSSILGWRRSSVRSCSNTSQRGQRGRAGERVARVGVAVEEGAELLVLAEEALVDALGGERRRQRQVAAGDALGQAHEVGRDVLVLAREHPARAAEAGGHLVADQQHAVPVAQRRARRAGSPRGARGCPPRPAPAARRSPPRPRPVLGQQRAPCRSASPGSACSVSNRSGRYVAWKRSIPPTETEPIVSPW